MQIIPLECLKFLLRANRLLIKKFIRTVAKSLKLHCKKNIRHSLQLLHIKSQLTLRCSVTGLFTYNYGMPQFKYGHCVTYHHVIIGLPDILDLDFSLFLSQLINH